MLIEDSIPGSSRESLCSMTLVMGLQLLLDPKIWVRAPSPSPTFGYQ
jgi:hypothetical protein